VEISSENQRHVFTIFYFCMPVVYDFSAFRIPVLYSLSNSSIIFSTFNNFLFKHIWNDFFQELKLIEEDHDRLKLL
jgi:hypothetical protein